MLTIIKKELKSFFNQPMAYILLVVFLAVVNFFYFRTLFLNGEATLRPMFSLMPWIFLFFIPALAMGILSKEKETGTFEILNTQSIKTKDIVIGKFVAVFLFVAIALIITIIAPITLGSFGSFDLGIIVSQYLGSLFLIAGFVAVSIFASSLTKNQIVAFVLGIAFNFVLVLVGFEMVVLAVAEPFNIILQKLSIFGHYESVSRGVLDIKDLIYFITLVIVFIWLSVFFFKRDLINRKNKEYRKSVQVLVGVIVLAILINLFGGYIKARIDLTSNRLFTLSKATRSIVSNMENEIVLDLFVSKKLPAQISYQAQDVRDILGDYKKYGKGKIDLNIHYPDVNEEDKLKAQELSIPAIQFNVIAKDEFQLKQGWLGLSVSVFSPSGQGEEQELLGKQAIPFIQRTSNFEYALTGLIWQMTNTDQKKIVFLTGHGEKSLQQDFTIINSELSKQYIVEELNLKNEDNTYVDITDDTAVVVIAGPSIPLDGTELGKVKEYLSNGGSAFLMGKQVEINPQYMIATSTDSNLNNILDDYGIGLENNVVYDLKSHETVTLGQGTVSYVLPYPLWLRGLAEENDVSKDIKTIVLPWTNEINLSKLGQVDGPVVKTLFSTTDAAGVQMIETINLDPQQQFITQGLNTRSLVVSVEKNEENRNTRLIVVGNNDFAVDGFGQNYQENLIFVLNSIEWLAQDDILSSIRAKNLTNSPLLFSSTGQRDRIKYFNMIGIPLIIAILGIWWLMRRRRISKREYES
ncbi:MAG: Gldg family protein [Patescibacteria group bacterium]